MIFDSWTNFANVQLSKSLIQYTNRLIYLAVYQEKELFILCS